MSKTKSKLPATSKFIVLHKNTEMPSTWTDQDKAIHKANLRRWRCSIAENSTVPRPIKMTNLALKVTLDFVELNEEQIKGYNQNICNHLSDNMGLFAANLTNFSDVKIITDFSENGTKDILTEMKIYR